MKDKILSLFAALLLAGFMSLPYTGRSEKVRQDINKNHAKVNKTLVNKLIVTNHNKHSNHKRKHHRVLATKYNPTVQQCDSDPYTTADLSKIDKSKLKSLELRWIAISRDLLPEYPYGTVVEIKCSNPKLNGLWEVHDVMNARHKFRIDFLVPINDEYNFHKPMLVDMYKV